MKRIFHSVALLVMILVGLMACQSGDQQAIQQRLTTFFSTTVMHSEVDLKALSKELSVLLQQAIEAEKNDALATKNGPYPTDKPLLIEGDIFSSLYEGRTGVKVQSIEIEKMHAKAILALENKHYSTQWTDTVILVKEDAEWKIDDVLFGQAKTQNSTRNVLSSFLRACRQKLNPTPRP